MKTAFAFVPWRVVEPSPGVYDFRAPDAFAQGARAAGFPYGWYFLHGRVWGSSPALAPPDHAMGEEERDAQGRGSGYPAWWNGAAREGYFRFVEVTLSRYAADPQFLAYYPSYGWMDASWGPAGTEPGRGFFGYAPSDQAAFRSWLGERYGGDINGLNTAWGTQYASFSAIGAPVADAPGFSDFQRFRQWSVAGKTWPTLVVEVDGVRVTAQRVEGGKYAAYAVPVSMQEGGHTLRAAFTNDAMWKGQDRNLYLDRFEVWPL